MLLKLFGILDLLSALILIFLKFDFGMGIAWFCVIYLFVKSIIFLSWISILDIVSAVVIILSIIGWSGIITWVVFFYLLQKAILSMLS